MTFVTSSSFASASAEGMDWRDTARKVLEKLEKAITKDGQFTLGFLYISDQLADDAESIFNLFKSVTGVPHWVGCTGIGVCASGQDHLNTPAISAMIGMFEEEDFKVFEFPFEDKETKSWIQNAQPMMIYVHGHPVSEPDLPHHLIQLQESTGGFVCGGLASARTHHALLADGTPQSAINGVMFKDTVAVSTALSQGCQPMGSLHTITKCEDHIIYEIDGDKTPLEVFESNIRAFVIKRTGQDPDEIEVEEGGLAGEGPVIPDHFKKVLTGEIHVAFPVLGTDSQDYLVRNIIGIDPDSGGMAVTHEVAVGDHILFAHRDEKTIIEDLSSMLVKFRDRVTKERGVFAPKAGLYVSCAGRQALRIHSEEPTIEPSQEMELIKEIIGEIPLTGYYASGEISKARLYGYTGILTLFF